MATTIVNIMQSKVINALDTYNHTAGLTSPYTVSIQMTEQPPSGVTLAIQQNSVTQASAAAPAASQGQLSLNALLNCAANDLISVVVSSSNPADSNINSIKGILRITPGQV